MLHYPSVEKQRYHDKHTSFITHRLITDWSPVDLTGAGPFFRVANAVHMEYLAFSHSLRSCSGVITSGSASSARSRPSATVIHDSNRVFNPEFVFCSKDWAFLYTFLNFREPNEQ